MATYLDGNVRKATPNTVKAMARSAEDRKCPKCGRKSALKRVTQDWGDVMASITYCRWKYENPPRCDYESVRTFGEQHLPPVPKMEEK